MRAQETFDVNIKNLSDIELVRGKVDLDGDRYDKNRNSVLNALLLITRHYIHVRRLFHNGDYTLIGWLRILRHRLEVEKKSM